MSSSTSSSEAGPARRWARFARLFVGVAAAVTVLLVGAAVLLDPYDTGRTPFDFPPGVRPQGPRTAAASRGRDPAFDAAIFGNSHVQLLSPEELKRLTGLSVVSLMIPASHVKEPLALIDWYLRHRAEPPAAIIVGTDHTWCQSDPTFPHPKPFPFWLYSRSAWDYVGGLMRFNVLEELPRRIAFIWSGKGERARPDGYWNYEPDYQLLGYDTNLALREKLETPNPVGGGNASQSFPAAERLEQALAGVPETRLVMIRPPAYRSTFPVPGSMDETASRACAKAFADLAARRPNSVYIDWRVDRPELRDPNHFFDHTHYRLPLARLIEADVAAALSRMK